MQNYEPRRRTSKSNFQNIHLHNNNNHNFINNFNNYTMKKAIAMKCNKEQFEAVKGKLPKDKVACISDFETCIYLTNNLGGYLITISNIVGRDKHDRDREIHETWNEKVFLEACGIETTFTITKETILKYEMKDEFPSVFQKEFVVGKWYKVIDLTGQFKNSKGALVCYSKGDHFGFGYSRENWTNTFKNLDKVI